MTTTTTNFQANTNMILSRALIRGLMKLFLISYKIIMKLVSYISWQITCSHAWVSAFLLDYYLSTYLINIVYVWDFFFHSLV